MTLVKETSNISEKFNARRDAMLEIPSHDLATSLSLLQQLTNHLMFEIDDTNNKMHKLQRLMQRTCLQDVTLIRDFVDNEFLESTDVEPKLNLKRVNLVSWLRVVMEEYQRSEQHTLLQLVSRPARRLFTSLLT